MKVRNIFIKVIILLSCTFSMSQCCNSYDRYISYEPVNYRHRIQFKKFNKILKPTKEIGDNIKNTILGRDIKLLHFMDSTNFLSHNSDTIYHIGRGCLPNLSLWEITYLNQHKVFINSYVSDSGTVGYNIKLPVKPSECDNLTARYGGEDSIMIDWITAWDVQALQQMLHNAATVSDGCILDVTRYIILNDTIIEMERCYFDEPGFWRVYPRSK